MAEVQVKASGGMVLVVLILIAGAVGLRIATLDDGKSDALLMSKIEDRIGGEFLPDSVDRLKSALDSGDIGAVAGVVRSVATDTLQIHSVTTSYPLFEFSSDKKVVVKVVYSYGDGSETGGHKTVYYRFHHSSFPSNWRFERETTVASYYLNFM